MKQTTAVAVSGGVDSMMSAYLLKEQGQHVIGIHFITGFENPCISGEDPAPDKTGSILQIGEQLGIPVEIVDVRDEFKAEIVDYFTRTYQRGQTPNPCMQCNPVIKFGTILDYALKLGASKLATGHYARIHTDPTGGIRLLKGLDPKKDQSYFLARLTGSQLARACFPLGESRKEDIKKMAARKGLHPVTRGESQDVCFIKNAAYGEFLSRQMGLRFEPGYIENMAGKVIGTHQGLHLFTRHQLPCRTTLLRCPAGCRTQSLDCGLQRGPADFRMQYNGYQLDWQSAHFAGRGVYQGALSQPGSCFNCRAAGCEHGHCQI